MNIVETIRNRTLSLRIPAPLAEGRLTEIRGLVLEGRIPGAAVGDFYKVRGRERDIEAEIVAVRGDHVVLMPYGTVEGIQAGTILVPQGSGSEIIVGDWALGRVFDALLRPLDGRLACHVGERRRVDQDATEPLKRDPGGRRLALGIRALDAMVPCGRGQRLGIFAGPGVGKSRLLGALTRTSSADVIVLALVGERGREVSDFLERVLGPAGKARSVVVVSTSDRPPLERLRCAATATTVAEYFRDQGASVLLVVDSLTRFAMAQRQIGLALGEPPTSKGYPPSVFAGLARLVERAGALKEGGSITGLYSVLVEGEEITDPVADSVKGLLDGHIALSRRLASRGHYPAIDVLASLSRMESELLDPSEILAARRVRAWMAKIEDSKDLLSLGAYTKGADPDLDAALAKRDDVERFLKQDLSERSEPSATREALLRLANVPSSPVREAVKGAA